MLFFNPLRRNELRSIRNDTYKKTKRKLLKASDNIIKTTDTVSKFNISRRTRKVLLITSIILGTFLLSVYIPSWITGNEKEVYYSLAYDPQALDFIETLSYAKYDSLDFDNDGLDNEKEYFKETDLFNPDTDGDGYFDGYDKNPLKKNSIVSKIKKKDKENGKSLEDPYIDEEVILWPDSYEYKTGVIIKDFNGYYTKGFKGWAQFPNSLHKYIYNYEDGKLKKLKYRETENAYYIKKDSYIVVLDDNPEYKYRITAAGNKYIFKNKIVGNILSFILPSKGTTYLKCEKIPQLKFNASNETTDINVVKFTNSYEDRLTKNTNSLSDISTVWNTIRHGKCVYVSFFQENKGESIGIVYGYTPEGNLLIADPETGSYAGTLKIILNGKKVYKNDNIEKYTWFDFKGLGFNSDDGDRINFFGTETDDEYISYFS